MEIKDMNSEQIEARMAEIRDTMDAEDADLEALTAEVDQLIERKAELEKKAAEKRSLLDKVAKDGGRVIASAEFEEKRSDNNMNDIKEYRNSQEYINLYAEFMKSGDDTELRAALLSTNVEAGTIPVPDFVHEIVKTAWDRNEIMRLVERVSVPGNYIVQFEISSSGAVIHTEGSGAVDEEELVEGIVKLVPEYAKKWKSFSKTVYALRGEAFVRYIYDEITYRIIKVIADTLIARIAALPQTATEDTPAAAKITGAPAIGLIAEAMGNLSDEAVNPVVVMNKRTWSAFKAAQYAGNFPADPFEGLAVHFNNSLPAYSSAASGAVYAIVGDFREGAIANFPNGEQVEFTFDTITRKKENLIEVLGELMVGVGPVADSAFTLIAKA